MATTAMMTGHFVILLPLQRRDEILIKALKSLYFLLINSRFY